jgi:hypothetical protein
LVVKLNEQIMNTNISSPKIAQHIVSRTAFSMYFITAFLGIFIVVGTGTWFFSIESESMPLEFPIMSICAPLLLGYLVWKDFKNIEIDGTHVSIKTWGRIETFTLKDIERYATMETEHRGTVTRYLIFKLTDGQDFTLNATHYSNYEALLEALTNNKPLDETLVKGLKRRQVQDMAGVMAIALLLNVVMVIVDPMSKALFMQAKYQIMLGIAMWAGVLGYQYWKTR